MKIGRSLEISYGGRGSALLHHIGGEEKNVGLYFGFCGDSDNDLESISLSLHLHQGVRRTHNLFETEIKVQLFGCYKH